MKKEDLFLYLSKKIKLNTIRNTHIIKNITPLYYYFSY